MLCLILKPKKPRDTDCVSGKEEEIVLEAEGKVARWSLHSSLSVNIQVAEGGRKTRSLLSFFVPCLQPTKCFQLMLSLHVHKQ